MNFFEESQLNKVNKRYFYYFFATISFLLFFNQLDFIKNYLFDEYHYLPAAREWLKLHTALNLEHPPLGKFIIAIGLKVFGDNPIGWRILSVFSAVGLILIIFKIGDLYFKNVIDSVFSTIIAMLNFWIFVLSRLGTLDIFLVLFFFTFVFLSIQLILTSEKKYFIWTGVFLGLTIAVKWSGIFLVLPIFAFLFFNFYKTKIKNLLLMILFSFFIYFITFIPFMLLDSSQRLNLFQILFSQPIQMYKLLSSVKGNHPYVSQWFTWPMQIRPMWFFIDINKAQGLWRGILLIGNPWIMLLGPLALGYLIFSWKKLERIMQMLIIAFGFSWLIWGIVQREVSFIYYFFPNAVMYSFFIPAALKISPFYQHKKVIYFFIILISLILFVHFYPLLIGEWVSIDHKSQWIWFRTWI